MSLHISQFEGRWGFRQSSIKLPLLRFVCCCVFPTSLYDFEKCFFTSVVRDTLLKHVYEGGVHDNEEHILFVGNYYIKCLSSVQFSNTNQPSLVWRCANLQAI